MRGGHIFDGAWAMVMIHDHYHGSWTAFRSETTRFRVMTPGRTGEFLRLFDPGLWDSIDFTNFTLFHHPGCKTYRFGVGLLLEKSPETNAPPAPGRASYHCP